MATAQDSLLTIVAHDSSDAGEYHCAVTNPDVPDLIIYSHLVRIEVGTVPSAVDEVTSEITDFKLNSNYPNPFNPTTVISYQLPVNSDVKLLVYDSLGRTVATLVNGQQQAGLHRVTFDASQLAGGIYFYRLQTSNGFGEVKKMVYVK